MKLEFRLLGEFAVLLDGHPLGLGGARQRSVLALLVLQRDRAVATESLADRLWPDERPLSAIKTIQVYVARLRSALGPEADRLDSVPGGYRLAIADDELDAARFERGLRQAREAQAAGSHDAAMATLEASLALWSGPALGDLAIEPFGRREADRLEELRLQATEELYELRIAAGLGRETVGDLRRLVGEQPDRERLWRLLMLAFYADGRQSEALGAYQGARRYLADELGLDPSPELQELQRAILTQQASRPSSTAPDPGAVADVAMAAVPGAPRTRRVVTVLRADVVREPDALDPEVLQAHDRHALDIVRRAVERHGGTIDRTDQDGVTAVFGLTVAREDDALRAIRAASELRDDPVPKEAADAVVLCVGIATGEVLAGPRDALGSTLAGAAFLVAGRLAGRAAPHDVLVARETERLARGAISTEPVFEPGREIAEAAAVRLIAVRAGDAIERRTTTPFVGRTSELDALRAAFERVGSDGTPSLVTVIGAPGVGKSRLVAESFARMPGQARILRSRCLPYGDGITYWPIRELVSAAAGIGPGEPRDVALAKLDALVAGSERADLVRDRIASVAGLSDAPAPPEEIPWAVRRLFETLAAKGPLVLLVDDLQWAEPVLLEVFEHVLDLGHGPLLLVTIARPELEDAHPEWLARASPSLVRLDALSDADAGVLLDRLAPELPPGQLRSRILAAAEGNPLFVEQFVAFAADEADSGDRGLTDRTAADLPIPPTIFALLAARLDRLPGEERRILERASIIGRSFWAAALAALVADGEEPALPRRLGRLTERGLIRPERAGSADGQAYRFGHLLIRDAAYASLPKRERAELHERFADWLEDRSGVDRGPYELIVGYHLEQAYRYRVELRDDAGGARRLADRALAFIAPAGMAAEERGDPHAAISLLRRAVDLAPEGRERIRLLIALRDALRTGGDLGSSDLVDAEVVDLLDEHPDEGLAHRRKLTEGWFGDTGTLAEAQAAYAYYQLVGDSVGMVRAREIAVGLMIGDGRLTAAAELLDEATDLALRMGRPDRAATLTAFMAFLFYYGPFPVPEVLVRLRRYLELAGDNGYARALVLMELGRLEAMTDASDRWRRHFGEAKGIIDDLGLLVPFGVAGYPKKLGATEVAAGDPARVVDLLLTSCSTLGRLGRPMVGHLATLASTTAEALLAVGRIDEAEHHASWARGISVSTDEQADWRIAMSGVRSRQGRHDEAVILAREALALVIQRGNEDLVDLARAHMSLAQALRGARDEPAALAAAREALRLATAKGDKAALRKIAAFLMVDG